MKIYDISREMFSTPPYPGDPKSRWEPLQRMDAGSEYNTSAYYACAHAGTHIDAPLHYVFEGTPIDQVDIHRFLGMCTVFTVKGLITGKDIDRMLLHSQKRILFRGAGQAFLSHSGAFALAEAGVLLVGTDASSIGMYEEETPPHKELLQAGIPILENLNLHGVREGDYFLSALPIKMAGMEAAPVRAVLVEG